MGFSTRNSDGASGRGEPINTVPRKVQAALEKDAKHHGCDMTEYHSVIRLGPGGKWSCEFPPDKAGTN